MLKWWEVSNIAESETADYVRKMQSAQQQAQYDADARADQIAQQKEADKKRKMDLLAQQAAYSWQCAAARQEQEVAYQEQQQKAQQAQYDKMDKAKVSATNKVISESGMNDASPEDMQAFLDDTATKQLIEAKLYSSLAQEALTSGDTTSYQKYNQAYNQVMSPPETTQTTQQNAPWWQKALGAVEAVDIPFMIQQHATLLKNVQDSGGDVRPQDKEFLDLLQSEMGQQDSSMIKRHFTTWIEGFKNLKPSEELKQAYYKSAGTGVSILEGFTTPLSAATMALPSGAGIRAGMAGKGALMAAKAAKATTTAGKVGAKAGEVAMQVGRGVLLPQELIEKGMTKVLSATIKVPKYAVQRFSKKWTQTAEQKKTIVDPIMRKIVGDEKLTPEELAVLKDWNPEFGAKAEKYYETFAAPEKAKITPEMVKPEVKPVVKPEVASKKVATTEVKPPVKVAVEKGVGLPEVEGRKFIGLTKETRQTSAPWRVAFEKGGEEHAGHFTSKIKAIEYAKGKLGVDLDPKTLKPFAKPVTEKVGTPAVEVKPPIAKSVVLKTPVTGEQAGMLGVPGKVHTQKRGFTYATEDMGDWIKYQKIMKKETPAFSKLEETWKDTGKQVKELEQSVYEKEATYQTMKETLHENPISDKVTRLAEIIPKTKEGVGELSYITKFQYKKWTGKEPSKLLLTDDGQHVKWELALDELAQELGYEQKAIGTRLQPDDLLRQDIEKVVKEHKKIEDIRMQLKTDEVEIAAMRKELEVASDELMRITVEEPWRLTPPVSIDDAIERTPITKGLTADDFRNVQEVPDGGMAKNVIHDLMDIEPFAKTEARLYPNGTEGNVAEWIQKKVTIKGHEIPEVPGARWLVSKIDPSMTARDTIKAKETQRIFAVGLDRIERQGASAKSIVGDIGHTILPDAKKTFQHTTRGMQDAFKVKPQFKTAASNLPGFKTLGTHTIDDVLTHPNWFDGVTDDVMKFYKFKNEVSDEALRFAKEHDVKINEIKYDDEGHYSPRMVLEAHGEKVAFPHVAPEKARVYEEGIEGALNDVVYNADPVQNLASLVDSVYRLVARTEMMKSVNALGRLAADSVPMDLRIAKEEAAKTVASLVNAGKVVNRISRGEVPLRQTLKSITDVSPELKPALDNLIKMKNKGVAAESLSNEIKEMLIAARTEAKITRSELSKAVNIMKSPQLGANEAKSVNKLFQGRIFDKETAKVIDEFTATSPGRALTLARNLSDTMRTSVAAGDLSVGVLQGWNILWRRPDVWGKAMKESMHTMFKPSWIPKFMSRTENVAVQQRVKNIARMSNEFYEGMNSIQKIPGIGKYWQGMLEPFERQFTAFGDVARVEMAKALEPAFRRAGQIDKLGTYVNRLTYTMNTTALGVRPSQRALESAFVFFAPRYTRAGLAFMGTLFEKGVTGTEARRTLAQMIGGGLAAYVGFCKALGKEPRLDPSKPTEFLTVDISGRRVGIGGIQYGLFKMGSEIIATLSESGGREKSDLLKIDDRKNPFLKFALSRSSTLTGAMIQGFSERDFIGDPLETPADWLHWAAVEHFMPIWVQEQIPPPGEPHPDPAAAFVTEMLGFRSRQLGQYFLLGNQYAQEAYGVKWEDLYRKDAEGNIDYSKLSPKQNILLMQHADLKEALEKEKADRAAWWRAEHGFRTSP